MDQKRLLEGESILFTALSDHQNQRLDLFIKSQLPGYSRTFLSKLIDLHAVLINGIPAKKPSVAIKIDDQIRINIPKSEARTTPLEEARAIPVTIVYEHDHFLIINKPAPLTVHPLCASDTRHLTLVDWIKAHYEEIAHVGNLDRPGIIHRLDKETSGLMIIPRTNHAYTVFGNLFKERLIHKTYLALVNGHPEPTGSILFEIGRHPIIRTRMKAYRPGDPILTPTRHATTHYTIVSSFKDHSLAKVTIITGRTHQIRVHFAAIGHSVLGDHMYGNNSSLIARHALHATSLQFTFEGTPFSFEQAPPDDFMNACK